MSKTYKPGQQAPISGEFGIVGPRGGATGQERLRSKGALSRRRPSPASGMSSIARLATGQVSRSKRRMEPAPMS